MRNWIGICLITFAATGCASNYDFEARRGQDARLDGARILQDFERGQQAGEEGLYDFVWAPLLHTHVRVVEKAEEEEAPEGYVVADIDAFLPFFGFVCLSVDRYDEEQEPLESHEFRSRFWGLCTRHTERVTTAHGIRERTERSLLWFIRWSTSPKYRDTDALATAR